MVNAEQHVAVGPDLGSVPCHSAERSSMTFGFQSRDYSRAAGSVENESRWNIDGFWEVLGRPSSYVRAFGGASRLRIAARFMCKSCSLRFVSGHKSCLTCCRVSSCTNKSPKAVVLLWKGRRRARTWRKCSTYLRHLGEVLHLAEL